MEWEDFQRVSTITNPVGEQRRREAEGDNEDLEGGERWGKEVGGREVTGHEDDK